MRGSPATAWCRSTMVTTCRAVFAQLQSPDTSTRCSISMGADTSPWPSKTSNCRLTRSTPSPISKPSSASASNQRVARMPPRQRWSPNWQTSLRGMNWKCLSQESSHSRMCARRFDRSNCATPAASWCCDHTQQGPEKEPDTGKLCLIPGLGGGNNTEEEWMNTETKLGGNFTLPGTSPNLHEIKIGIDSFVAAVPDALTGETQTLSSADRLRLLLDEIEFADRVGLDVFGVGEHHRAEFLDSAPETILAAAAVRTERIRLTSAVTVLSANDPVRVFQQFATIDLLSRGRAEMIVGRGSFIEAFPL